MLENIARKRSASDIGRKRGSIARKSASVGREGVARRASVDANAVAVVVQLEGAAVPAESQSTEGEKLDGLSKFVTEDE